MRHDEVVERVLLAVEQIPAGRVASYGGIAAITGTSPRLVGRIMKDHGSGVPWWRVTSRDGDFGGALLTEALPHWDAEGIRVKPNGLGCRFADHAADFDELRDAYLTVLRARERGLAEEGER